MQHKYTHAAIIAKYEDGLSIIRFDYNEGKPCEIDGDIKFQIN